jgi:hypothetical protein
MRVKMSILTRLKLSELLEGQAGSYARLKAIRTAREELSLSDEEITATGYVEKEAGNGRTSSAWDAAKDQNKECELSEVMVELIVQKLKKLDETEKLTEAQIPLYEAFVKVQDAMKK